MATTLVDVSCPEGAGEGHNILVEHGGQSFTVIVPPGLSVGDTFHVELALPDPEPSPADAHDILSLSDDDDDEWYYAGDDQSAGSAAQAVVSGALQASLLKPHEAASLRRITKAVNTFTAIDDLVRVHAAAFSAYSAEGEQRLEWTLVHRQFVELVEARVSLELDQLNANNVRGPTPHRTRLVMVGGWVGGWEGGGAVPVGRPIAASAACMQLVLPWQGDLVALLASVSGQDAHADAFLARLQSLSDYSFFCEQMRAGGGALRGSSGDDVNV